MGQCSSSNKKLAPGQQGPRESEESREEYCEELAPNAPRRRGVVDDSAAPRVPANGESSLQHRPQLEEYKLAAVRGSVDDSTCAALLALRLGRGSSVNGLVKEGRGSDDFGGGSNYSRASGGSHDSKHTGKADPHSTQHNLDPLPEDESVQLASKTLGSDADGLGDAPGDPAAQRGAADTSTQHDNNPNQGSLQTGAGAGAGTGAGAGAGAVGDEAKAGAHGPGRADAAAKKRQVDAGGIFEAELGLSPNALTLAVSGAAPKVPARA
ncbi:hypothetical protein HYH02_010588 [Chlamydomonas schloesseri]|uniref:Uncharacterized protein n=1 Tax=Chlamydomonas schloesseri TaxID=2026947 RepID=A0A835W769_9CHLO|nr:hypothetical protein HYH02_010588 [Chlamydomonas schloesseri]|eukprot:KAG2439709.1 hypothetical protein HYH02_010588 [Chlamydomonas schloesseri]